MHAIHAVGRQREPREAWPERQVEPLTRWVVDRASAHKEFEIETGPLTHAQIVHVNVGAESGVIGEIAAIMIRVLIDRDWIAVPQPVRAEAVVVRDDTEIEVVEPETFPGPALEMKHMAPTEAASKPLNVSPPTISGVAQSGQQLSASPGSWTESPTSFSYRWRRCDPSGASCAAVSGATSSSYTLASADVGTTLRVTVIASNGAGPEEGAGGGAKEASAGR